MQWKLASFFSATKSRENLFSSLFCLSRRALSTEKEKSKINEYSELPEWSQPAGRFDGWNRTISERENAKGCERRVRIFRTRRWKYPDVDVINSPFRRILHFNIHSLMAGYFSQFNLGSRCLFHQETFFYSSDFVALILSFFLFFSFLLFVSREILWYVEKLEERRSTVELIQLSDIFGEKELFWYENEFFLDELGTTKRNLYFFLIKESFSL